MYSSTLPSTSALDGGGWSTPSPQPLYARESAGTHCTGGWVGPRAGLARCGKSRPAPEFDLRTVQFTGVAIPTELSRPRSITI